MVLVGVGVAMCVGGIAVLVARHAAPAEVVVTQNTPEAQPAPESAPVSQPVEPAPTPEPPPVIQAPSEPPKVVVSIMGEVLSPGVFTLPGTARVDDLIEAAGGATQDADFSDINRAALLVDGSTLTIPKQSPAPPADGRVRIRRPEPAPPRNPPQYTITGWQPSSEPASPASIASGGHSPSSSAETSGLVELNRASAEQLQTLPGIGPKLAEAIIAYRKQRPFATVDDLQNVRGIGPKRLESLRSLVTVAR